LIQRKPLASSARSYPGRKRTPTEANMTAHASTKDLLPRLQRSATHAIAPLQREMNRFFEELEEGWETFAAPGPLPSMDVAETKAGMEITLELPGLSQEDVTISVDDDRLTVTGEKKSQYEAKDRTYRLTERHYGRFSRSLYLPRSYDAASVQATMKDGVLKLVAPRRPEAAGAKTIAIQAT
jgi:HSP20 family protein